MNIGGREFKCPPFSIEFEQKVIINAPTMTECKLYNPNNDTIKSAEGTKKGTYYDGPQVVITAGYEEENGICVLGKCSHFEVKRHGADTILAMKIWDTPTIWANTMIATTYNNLKISSIIQAIVNKAGLRFDSIKVGSDKILPTFTAQYFNTALQNLCKDSDSEYFFNNGILTVQSKTKLGTANAILLTPKTGLIDLPEKTQGGIKFKTLFLYKLMGGSIVKIESNNYNSVFKIIHGKKKFSTFGKAECEFEAQAV
ncbi:MAG: hypothetical protein PHX78_12490 [bacterium]|nr:hypothetical protein [bacterium]